MSPVAHHLIVALVNSLVPSIERRVAVFDAVVDVVGAFLGEAVLDAVDPSSSCPWSPLLLS
jgi:hypothetical protein